MTVVALWYETYDDAAWIVADTRVSHATPTAGTISDSAAKIFPLQINCFAPGQDGFFDQLTYTTSIGFTYAGATLPALMTYSVLASCLRTLNGLPGWAPPSLEDVAHLVQRIANKYLTETLSQFELAILGWCPLATKYRAFIFRPDGKPFRMQFIEAPLYEAEHFTLLGSHKKNVRRLIEDVFCELHQQSLKRAPKLALQRLIEADSLAGVGGSLQIGTAMRQSFSLKWWCRPLVSGQPAAGRFLLGLNIDNEIGPVGNYAIGMTGTV